MGTNSLTTRASGDTITASFFNDFNTAFGGDFVGRNTSGVPASGQNLGTVALPWGTIRCNSIVVNGSALDASLVAQPQNTVTSGKKRATSNQPAFITPNGAAASFILAGLTTNLVVDINGTSVAVSTDITKSSLTVAPGSNNTCLVNDTLAADQHDTRLWGEPEHRKVITIDTVGSEITSRNGQYASFKLDNGSVTEYFFGLIDTTNNRIHKIKRGFYYDSSLNPKNRIVFSNNDTITLLNTAWVFVTNDGTTVDVSYTQPVWDFTAPSSPVTGDYWYDMANQTWKRYDGASFQIISRTLVAQVCLDATNCIGARCMDFHADYRSDNSMEIEVSTTEIAKSVKQGSRVQVMGTAIDFRQSTPLWNITTDLATSVDMYDATEQASRMYYLYLKDTGDTVISDISPYFRTDLFGEYHPHNPWRCVGLAYNNASSNITNASSPINFNTSIMATFGNGFGAVSTKIRRFTNNPVNLGADLIYLDSANLGASLNCFWPGKFSFTYGDIRGGNASIHGLSLNTTEPTTSIDAISNTDRLVGVLAPSNTYTACSRSIQLKIGDFVNPHVDATQSNEGNFGQAISADRVG